MNPASSSPTRVLSIDLLRGAVMIIMALDHCRDFFHHDSIAGIDPFDFSKTTPALAFTRWITHFCAPIFIFLAGISISLMHRRRSSASLSGFLLTRGLWLIFLEIVVFTIGWEGNFSFAFIGLFVIWVIGLSMIFMAALIHLPRYLLLLFSLVMIFGHNLLDRYNDVGNQSGMDLFWSMLHVPNGFSDGSGHFLVTGYPLIPWVGVMALEFCVGPVFSSGFDPWLRRKRLISAGTACICLFILLRTWNLYGEASPWDERSTWALSLFSFLNTTKYPPSLLYLLMTLGPALIFLAYADRWRGRVAEVVSVYGRVPFFYYLLHVFLIHWACKLLFFATGHRSEELVSDWIAGLPSGFGVDLWQVYLVWIGVVVILYFPCRWYDRYKRSHNHWWLSYL